MLYASLSNAASAEVAAGVVVRIQAADLHIAATSVDELIVSNVDTNVRSRSIGVICTVEEHQIAGLQVGIAYGIAVFQLIGSSAVDGIAAGPHDVLDIARAVKARRRGAAPNIRNAQILLSFLYNGIASSTAGGTGRRGVRRIGARTGIGNAANGIAVDEVLGAVGRTGILIGNLGEVQKIGTDVTDLTVIDDLIPTTIEADDVSFVTTGNLIHNGAGGVGFASHVYQAAIDSAITKFDVLTIFYVEVFAVHVTFGKVINDLVPVALFAGDNNIIIIVGDFHDFTAGIRL